VGTRSEEDVKRELESERERLGDAVTELRSQADRMARRLPIMAVTAVATALVLRSAAKHLHRLWADRD
jgi:hypothetical protein